MVHIVFTADNHLGKYYAKMSPTQLRERRKRLREAWKKTVDYAIEHKVHFYLHGGDLFDSPNPRTSELVWAARQFQRLHEAGVITLLISGNHDVPRSRLGGATPQRIYGELRAAHCFTKVKEVEWKTYSVDGATIAIGGLAPDPRLSPEDDPLKDVRIEPPEADVVLLMTHYGIEGTLPPDAREPQIPKSQIALLKGVDFLLIGHLHEHLRMKIGDVTIYTPGPTERMDFGEMNVKPGFLSLKVFGKRPVKSELEHVPIRPQPMRRLEIRTTDLPEEGVTEYILHRIKEISGRRQLLQCRVEGPLPRVIYRQIRFFDIWRAGNEWNAYFDLDRKAVYVQADSVPEGIYVPAKVSPVQEIHAVADSLLRDASDEERQFIEEARTLILQTWEGEGV